MTMTIKQFIENAVEGGWKPTDDFQLTFEESMHRILLDPEAWEAVEKAGWWEPDNHVERPEEWMYKMRWMIDALIEGKSIEEYIETL